MLDRLFTKSPLPVSVTKFYIVAQRVSDKRLVPEHRGRNITVKEVLQAGVERMRHPCPRPSHVIDSRYKQSAVCFSAYSEDKFAGCIWLTTDKYCEDVVRCTFSLPDNNSVWDFDAYVDPQYRISPVFLKLWDYTYGWMREEGRQWSISRISAFNSNSRNVHRRMGATDLGSMVFFRVGRWQFTLSTFKPRLHLSFSKSTAPVFVVCPPD